MKNLLALLLFLLAGPALALGPYSNVVLDEAGNGVAAVNVTVYLADTVTLASLYSDNGTTPIANPLTTDYAGRFEFWAANGLYDVCYSKTGIEPWCDENEKIIDAGHVGAAVFNVLDSAYGAVGDGVTDDNEAIQAAIDAASAAKGTVLLGGGLRYFIGEKLMMKDNVTLTGDGTLVRNSTGACTYTIHATEVDNWTIRGIRFEGDGDGVYQPSGTYNHIEINGGNNILIDGIYSTGAEGDAIQITTRSSHHSEYPTNVRVVNCYLKDSDRSAVVVGAGDNIVISNNTIENAAGACIDLEPWDAAQFTGSLVITGNAVLNTWELDPSDTYASVPHLLDASWPYDGMVKDVEISGNHFEQRLPAPDPDFAYGPLMVIIEARKTRLTFANNTLVTNLLSTATSTDCLLTIHNDCGFNVVNNTIQGPTTNATGKTWGQYAAISIRNNGSTQDERVRVTGNRISGLFDIGIRVRSVDGIVLDNTIAAGKSAAQYLDEVRGARITGAVNDAYCAVWLLNSSDIVASGCLWDVTHFNFVYQGTNGPVAAVGVMTNKMTGSGSFPNLTMYNVSSGGGTWSFNELATVQGTIP